MKESPVNGIRVPLVRAAAIAAAFAAYSCAGSRPDHLGIHDSLLGACPPSPNCVSSDSNEREHAIPAFYLAGDTAEGWRAARDAVAALPRTVIVKETADYLHAECSSRLFGFVDDLELHVRGEPGVIAVRSASRLGYSDMGVNRQRVESLRRILERAGRLVRETGGSD
jgi:uncharacterized protein (DUF1499 family)